jgi:hypothetical protein
MSSRIAQNHRIEAKRSRLAQASRTRVHRLDVLRHAGSLAAPDEGLGPAVARVGYIHSISDDDRSETPAIGEDFQARAKFCGLGHIEPHRLGHRPAGLRDSLPETHQVIFEYVPRQSILPPLEADRQVLLVQCRHHLACTRAIDLARQRRAGKRPIGTAGLWQRRTAPGRQLRGSVLWLVR